MENLPALPGPEPAREEPAPSEVGIRFGWALFTEEGSAKRAAALLELIERLRAFSTPYRFTHFKYGTSSDTRYDEVTKRRWEIIREEIRRTAFDLAPGKMLSLKNRFDAEPFGQVHLEIMFRTSRQRLHAVYFTIVPEAVAKPERLRALAEIADWAWENLGGVHAYMNPVLAMELYHGGNFAKACDILSANRVLEIHDDWNFLPLFREKAKGPSWSIFLGPKPLEILGGLDRVSREAPVALVRSLPGGGAAIEMLDAPVWEENAGSVDAYARFFEYLKPVTAIGVAPLVLGKPLAKRGILRSLRFSAGPQAVLESLPKAPRPRKVLPARAAFRPRRP
ncbi:MAG: hypothetical protein AAB215_00665 [Planctomycetota bacterium]